MIFRLCVSLNQLSTNPFSAMILNHDVFLKRCVHEQRQDVIGYQYVILVDVQVLNLFSEKKVTGIV